MTEAKKMTQKQESVFTPKLRFPEFRNDPAWTPVTLRDVSVPVEEKVGDRKLTPVSISAGIGFVPQAEKFGRDISGKQYKLYTVVRDGDFVYNKGNSLRFPQGCIYQLRGWGEVAAPNVFICFRIKEGYSDGFFQSCFEKNIHGIQLQRHITSGARSNGLLNISRDTFFNIRIPTPSLAEQQKIAECLSTLDDLIEAESRKLDTLKDHKKGLMQQLFPREGETRPRFRFPEFQSSGDWKPGKLGSEIQLISGTHLDPDQYGTVGEIPYFSGPSDFTNDVGGVTKWTSRSTSMAVSNDILITVKGSGVGELWFSTLPAVALGRQLMAIRSKGTSIHFIYQLLLTKKAQFQRLGAGNLIPGLSRADILEMQVYFPHQREQKRIASCLSSLDEVIDEQENKLEVLRTHKRGLMQQLFPTSSEFES